MTASKKIDEQIARLTGWRRPTMVHLREIINAADSRLEEEFKWQTAVWSAQGNVCALGAFKDHVKVNFFQGALLPDTDHLFNSGLEAKTSRAIDLYEGQTINDAKLKALVRAAVAHNFSAK